MISVQKVLFSRPGRLTNPCSAATNAQAYLATNIFPNVFIMNNVFSKAAFCAPGPLFPSLGVSSSCSLIARRGRPVAASSASLRSRFGVTVATAAATSSSNSDASVDSTATTRVRFAPSPTGALHVGGARTALYNWLLARQKSGAFLLRVEDTDLARSTRESEQMVLEDLRWLGLHWDEGPDVGGDREPYRQSERSEIYTKYANRLIDEGKAYACFCTEDELEKKRLQAESEGRPPQYDGTWRDADPDLVQERLDAGESYTIRFRVPDGSRVVIDDAVRGKVAWDANATVGDFILLRSNGVPVYNFCVAVDDALMGITTVIRAEEHLTNTLRQILILRALNFPIPQYAHCSLILGSDRSKLSKRHGATSVTQFREEGYLPDAMVNYLALLGWNDGTEKEIYTVDELIEAFDINRITKSPAMFDGDKLRFINGQHLRALSDEQIGMLILPEWHRSGVFYNSLRAGSELARKAILLIRGSLQLVNDANEEMSNVFSFPLADTLNGNEAEELVGEEGGFETLSRIVLRDYDAGTMPIGTSGEDHTSQWKKWVKAIGKETGRKGKRLFHPLRLALTGKMSGPDVGDIIQVLHLTESEGAAPNVVTIQERIRILREVLSRM